jgi:hypothetical protein
MVQNIHSRNRSRLTADSRRVYASPGTREEVYNLPQTLQTSELTAYQSAIVKTLDRVIDPSSQRIHLSMIASPYYSETHLSLEPLREPEDSTVDLTEAPQATAETAVMSALADAFDQIEDRFDSIIATVDDTCKELRRMRHGKRN